MIIIKLLGIIAAALLIVILSAIGHDPNLARKFKEWRSRK